MVREGQSPAYIINELCTRSSVSCSHRRGFYVKGLYCVHWNGAVVGSTVDTNSLFLSQRLTELGIKVEGKVVVDDARDIREA